MHLLEAFLALQEGGACGDLSFRIAAMVALFDRHFFGAEDAVLTEYYDAHWTPANPARAFEPGHHFEWAWLLTRHAAMTGISMEDRIAALLRSGLRGIDAQGRIVDEMGTDGPVAASCRLWSSMEAAKALNTRHGRAAVPGGSATVLTNAWQPFFANAVPGGWIDQVDATGARLVDYMPASSLYHICTALDDQRCTAE
jgi:mannose-6-phosphate isomerase